MSLFRVFFVLLPLSLSVESTSYVPSFRMVFFYLVITGWILDIGLDEKSFKKIKSIMVSLVFVLASLHSDYLCKCTV